MLHRGRDVLHIAHTLRDGGVHGCRVGAAEPPLLVRGVVTELLLPEEENNKLR